MADWFEDFTSKRQGSLIDDATGAIKFGLKKVDEAVDYVVNNGQEFVENLNGPLGTIVNGTEINGKKVNGLAETATQLGEASYDVPYNAAKSLGAPEGVAIAAGVAGSLLEPSPLGEAKAATVAGDLLQKARPLKKGTPPPPGTPLPGAQPPQVAFAANGGGLQTTVPQPQLNDHVWRLSNHDPEFLEHGRARQGMAEEFPDHFAKLNKDFDGYKRWSREWTSRISQMPPVHGAKDPTAYQPRIRLYRDRVNGVVDKKQFQRVDPELISQDLKRMMDQHHLFPVADSAAFVGKMMDMIRAGKADNDDLLNMFIYADYMGATMGNSWRNMLNMSQKPHDALHAMYQTRGQKLFGSLDDVESSNDLHRKLKEYIVERAIPSKKEAIKLQKEHFDTLSFPQKEEYLHELMEFKMTFEKQLSAKQKSAYEEYIEALRARGSQ